MGLDWSEVSGILSEMCPEDGEKNEFKFLDGNRIPWKAIVFRETLSLGGDLVRVEMLQGVRRECESSIAVYELFWPEGADLPVLQYAARGILFADHGEVVQGIWVARTERQASCASDPAGITFSESCLGTLSPTEAEEQFLGCIRYFASQNQSIESPELKLDLP